MRPQLLIYATFLTSSTCESDEVNLNSTLDFPLSPWSALFWRLFPVSRFELTTTTEKPTTTTAHFPTRSPITSGRKRFKNCKKFSKADLYKMLEDAGGYNQQFMAQTPHEAGLRFSRLLRPHLLPTSQDGYGSPPTMKPAAPGHCDSNCGFIRGQLESMLEFRRNLTDVLDLRQNTEFGPDPGPLEVQEGDNSTLTRKKGCFLESFIPIGNCTARGAEEVWGYEKLCAACPGVYLLPPDCFPQFFNAVQCDSKDRKCIFDWWSSAAHGKCQERSLSFTVMQNIGTEECEEWSYENLNVPISCECYLNKGSWLRA